MISRKQIAEWVDNPVTLALRKLCAEELENTFSVPVSEFLIRSDPQKTQENLIEHANKEQEWVFFAALLTGDWEDLNHLDSFYQQVEREDADSDE